MRASALLRLVAGDKVTQEPALTFSVEASAEVNWTSDVRGADITGSGARDDADPLRFEAGFPGWHFDDVVRELADNRAA